MNLTPPGPGVPAFSRWDHNLQTHVGPPTAKWRQVHSKCHGFSGFGKQPSGLLVLGFPTPAICLRGTAATDVSTLRAPVYQRLGLTGGWRVSGNKSKDTSPWVFLLAHPSHSDNPERGLSLWLRDIVTIVASSEFCHLVVVFCKNNTKSGASGHSPGLTTHPDCGTVNDNCPEEMSWGRYQKWIQNNTNLLDANFNR